MSWSEFCSLLSGIMPDTPLGYVVGIRAEKDSKVIKNYTNDQKKIKRDWAYRQNQKRKENPDAYKDYWSRMQADLKSMFS